MRLRITLAHLAIFYIVQATVQAGFPAEFRYPAIAGKRAAAEKAVNDGMSKESERARIG
jgi:hypothetical protein